MLECMWIIILHCGKPDCSHSIYLYTPYFTEVSLQLHHRDCTRDGTTRGKGSSQLPCRNSTCAHTQYYYVYFKWQVPPIVAAPMKFKVKGK